MPQCKISGLLYGTRVLEQSETMIFEDKKNDIWCQLTFSEGGGFFSKSDFPTDYF